VLGKCVSVCLVLFSLSPDISVLKWIWYLRRSTQVSIILNAESWRFFLPSALINGRRRCLWASRGMKLTRHVNEIHLKNGSWTWKWSVSVCEWIVDTSVMWNPPQNSKEAFSIVKLKASLKVKTNVIMVHIMFKMHRIKHTLVKCLLSFGQDLASVCRCNAAVVCYEWGSGCCNIKYEGGVHTVTSCLYVCLYYYLYCYY